MNIDIVKNFKNIVIAVLVVTILLMKACQKPVKPCPEYISKVKSDTTIVHDTVYVKHEVTGTVKPTKVKTIPNVKKDTTIVNNCEDTVIFNNDIPIDSVGFINIEDTVTNNEIVGRKYKAVYNIPTITNTITIRDSVFIKENIKKRTQWYIGGELGGDQYDPFKTIGAGILIKNKKDGIFGAKINLDLNGKVTYGIQKYFKIKLHK